MATKEAFKELLAGGNLRTIGRAAEAVEEVRRNPRRTAELIDCLWVEDPVVRMRAADALEKLSRDGALQLQPFKEGLLTLLAETKQKELRWHLALIVPRLRLNKTECRGSAEVLQRYLNDRSSIVKTFAMQGLADLTRQEASLRLVTLDILHSLTNSGTPAMRARGRILLKRMER